MADFQKRKKLRRIFYSPLSIVLFAVVAFFLAKGVWNIFEKERLAKEEAGVAQANLTLLEKRQAALLAEIDRLQSQRGIEEELRAKFNATKPGEGVIVIVDNQSGDARKAATTTSWWQKFLGLF